jgi:hypothetical protein
MSRDQAAGLTVADLEQRRSAFAQVGQWIVISDVLQLGTGVRDEREPNASWHGDTSAK